MHFEKCENHQIMLFTKGNGTEQDIIYEKSKTHANFSILERIAWEIQKISEFYFSFFIHKTMKKKGIV